MKRQITSLQGFIPKLLLTVLTLGLTGTAFAQAPILPVQQTTRTLPMLGEAIRDPKVLRNEVRDDLQASSVKREIGEAISDLKRAKSSRKAELVRTLLSNYASLVAYYEDILNGTLTAEGNNASSADLSKARGQMIKWAAAYAKLAKGRNQVAQARYHYHTQKYVLGSERSRAIANLKTLKNLDGYLKRRAELVVALHELDYGNKATQNRAKSKLYSLIRPLHLEGAIVARLALARKHAGMNSKGRKYLKADKKYRYYLSHASKRATGLSAANKKAVLAYSLGVWRAAEGRRAGWDNPPIRLAAFSGLNEVDGIVERQAISFWSKRNYNKAATMYAALSSKYQGKPQAVRMDMRILDIRKSEYARTDRSRNYEVALQKMLEKYRSNAPVAAQIKTRYQAMIDQEIRLAKSSKATKAKRSSVITLLGRFKDSIEDEQTRYRYEETIGDLYALNKDHRNAVGVYLDLAMNSKASNKKVLYGKAVKSQRVLASWPASAPWQGIRGGKPTERTQLLAMHKDQLKLYDAKRPEWSLLAHTGLLEISLGESASAFKRWEKVMAKTPSNHSDARQAAGFMLEVHNRTKNWASQERMVRLCMKTGLRPLRGKRGFNLSALLAEALLNGGRELLANGKPKQAREKLAEFVAKFRQHKQHDEGQFLLAHAYRGEGDHKQSISTLVALTKDHPRSEYMSRALIKGGDWGIAMALEEEPIYFHQMYVDKYAGGKETPRIRDGLVVLYEGRQLIGQATNLLEQQANDRRLSHGRKLAAAVEMLEMEEAYGGDDKAMRASNLILRLAKSETGAKAKALAYQVRYHNAKRDLPKMQALESKITKLGGDGETVDALAEARLYIALYINQAQRDEIHSVALRDPLATLNEEYKYYLTTKKLFDRVCRAGDSGYCAPAMLHISAKAEDMKVRIEDISIAEDLDKKTVDTFENRKRAIMTTIQNHQDSYVLKASQVVKRGNTNPAYTDQILWENSNDWNFDRITGEVGNGYIQFSPDHVVAE